MWIEHIGTIGMVAVVVLVALHFGVHFYFKWKKKRQNNAQESKN